MREVNLPEPLRLQRLPTMERPCACGVIGDVESWRERLLWDNPWWTDKIYASVVSQHTPEACPGKVQP